VAAGKAAEAAELLERRFREEFEEHFVVEEELLLPALRAAGEVALVATTEADHAFLRAQAEAARGGDAPALLIFAERLTAHVRFEERELYPRVEGLVGSILDDVARRRPKPASRPGAGR